jgi:hypothetical protein
MLRIQHGFACDQLKGDMRKGSRPFSVRMCWSRVDQSMVLSQTSVLLRGLHERQQDGAETSAELNASVTARQQRV